MPIAEVEYRNWEFDETFVEFLQERWRARQRARKIGQYYPSTIWRCLRQEILTWESQVMPSSKVLKHFFAGDLYQDHIIDPIVKWKFGNNWTKIEQRICIAIPVTPEEDEFIWLRGRIDEMTFIEVEGNLVAIPNEAKTQRKGLEYRKKPKEDHVYQLMVYMAAIGAPYGKLIYMDRSTLDSKTYHIDFDLNIFKKILDRTRTYHSFVTKRGNELPPAESLFPKKNRWMCVECPVKDFCWKHEGIEDK